MTMQIKYLSHGLHETGGYYHEKTLSAALADGLLNCDLCYKDIRFRKNYKGIWGWIQLFFLAFKNAKADVVITVARLAWPVLLRNLFNQNKIVLVLHNYDPRDGKPSLYYVLLNKFLKKAAKNPHKFTLVVVAEYWKNYFSKNFRFKDNIYIFPNLMETAKLQFYKDVVHKKSNLIHLGQWSEKVDKKAYLILIDALKKHNIAPYFSDYTGANTNDFPVSHFTTREAYLKQMALSKYTIIINKIEEGWNRVAHESFCVGTPVLGIGGGGLTEMIELGGGKIFENVDALLAYLSENNLPEINYPALQKLDVKEAAQYAIPVVNSLRKK